jgi:hypothetical protein
MELIVAERALPIKKSVFLEAKVIELPLKRAEVFASKVKGQDKLLNILDARKDHFGSGGIPVDEIVVFGSRDHRPQLEKERLALVDSRLQRRFTG